MVLASNSNDLKDFLTALYGTEVQQFGVLERMEQAKDHFYRYLHARGIEHCNFGCFGLNEEGGVVDEFSGSLLDPDFLQEYYDDGMERDDYVLLRAATLDDERRYDLFQVGLSLCDELPEELERSREVQERCAEAGIRDGIAFIGQAPLSPLNPEQRFFGFVYAGEMGSAAHARDQFDELQVASFALMGQIKPEFEAQRDGFSYDVTDRERQMLVFLAKGMQRAQIAFEANLSLPTVDMHLRNLRAKLGAQTLAEAVAKGYRFGLID